MGFKSKMKYLKLFEDRLDADSIKNWLTEMGVQEYTIKPDLTIDAKVVRLADKNLATIMVEFSKVFNFYIQQNKLTDLKNSPREVTNVFSCGSNQVISLANGPKIVGKRYIYYNNPCSFDIEQVKHIPLNCMLNSGGVWNMKVSTSVHFFKMPQIDMDEYWNNILTNVEPLYLKNLTINKGEYTEQSNNISQKLYDKYKYITRSKDILWNLKI